jgi:5'-nucleotidase
MALAVRRLLPVALLALGAAALVSPAPASATGTSHTIEQIQGTGPVSPLAGTAVTTRGVVTASYPTGGLGGFTLQTAGTGGALDLAHHHASDALFVYVGGSGPYPRAGTYVSVEGTVTEFHGLTELLPATGGVTVLPDRVAPPRPAQVSWPAAESVRESLESMLVAPLGPFAVTDNGDTNRYAEIGLARGTGPLRQPTDVARPGGPARAVAAANAERLVTLDDGATTDFLPPGGGPQQDVPLPYLHPAQPVRVGAAVRFTRPVVVDYRNDAWTLEPTSQVTARNEAAVSPVRIADTRTARPRRVGGDLSLAGFNVLNYFTETGADWVAHGGTCTFYDDRNGNHVADKVCSGQGPRGAADDGDLRRQQAKIVAAINTLGADVVSLEEIENSAKYGPDRDTALATLVRALNTAAGRHRWDLVPSPADRPTVADEDVIRTALIYQPAHVQPVGGSRILVGSPPFDNAREPLAQEFRPRPVTGTEPFVVIANHFKSKGSGVDDGTGQGAANPDRVAEATALVRFAAEVRAVTHTRRTFLVGDFNSYTHEDPMRRLYAAGYTDIGSRLTRESTYVFGGLVGSLDHVLANPPALRSVTGADVWNINSVESVAFEYSRDNANATDFYAPDPFRSSDHDPLLVGVRSR